MLFNFLRSLTCTFHQVSAATVYRHREVHREAAADKTLDILTTQPSLQLGFDGKKLLGKERYVFNAIHDSPDKNRYSLLKYCMLVCVW